MHKGKVLNLPFCILLNVVFFYAACHVRMKRSAMIQENPISFNADHMFVFMIVDRAVSVLSNQSKILFYGCYRSISKVSQFKDEF